ncbi:MAG: ABC transporter permease subunit [Saprospiraceae bacterium]|nr:ABC transporter permease subunit [Saprospiraceae bacterium]
MREVWIIARRELGAFFDSLVAYILLIAFLGFTGFFTWLSVADVFFRKQADLQVFFNVAMWTLFIFIPAITMRQLAEEKKSGTIELLLTKAISDRQVILGKFVGCFLLVCIALLFTLPYYLTVASIGNIDHGATISGYLGLILMSMAYIGIGLFASSATNNQIVALLLALMIGILFHFLFNAIASNFTGALGQLISDLSVTKHFDSIIRGVIDSKDVIYFLSLTALGLLFSEVMISKRK